MTRRRTNIRTLSGGLLLGLACALPSPAAAQIGLLAGYNRDALGDFLPSSGFDLTDLTGGYHVGVFLNVNFAAFGLRPALVYHRMPGLTAEAGGDRTEFDIDLIEIPVDVRLRIPSPIVSPYLVAGPVLAFPSSDDEGVDALLEARPLRAEVGVGLELDLGVRLWPEVRYGIGITSLMKSDIPVGTTVLRGDGDPRLDTFTLRLGISF